MSIFTNIIKKKSTKPTFKESHQKKSTLEKKETVSKNLNTKKDVSLSTHTKQIFIRPVVTEKVTMLNELNTFVFEVHPDTNKIEVAKEIKRLYDVIPTSVRMMNKAGKRVRYGRRTGTTKRWKKALITLKQGDSIETFKG